MRYVIYCGRFDGMLKYCVHDEVSQQYFNARENSWVNNGATRCWSPNLTKILEVLRSNLSLTKVDFLPKMEFISI